MTLIELGWDKFFDAHFRKMQLSGCVPARVREQHGTKYGVVSASGESLAHITGKIRYHALARTDIPTVGDWVVIAERPDEQRATIQAILPRKTALIRKNPGKSVDGQILASNADFVFVVAALNQEYNLRRIERYLATVWESGAQPVVLLNKADLCTDPATFESQAESVSPGTAVHSLCALNANDVQRLLSYYLKTGTTAAFIGSSGVGKSTIINSLIGTDVNRISAVRHTDDRGRHATTTRQMFFLTGGGIVIDTPGLRELQLWETDSGLAQAFEDIESYAQQCKFRDCGHRNEPGCAVTAAVHEGRIAAKRVANYVKMRAELSFLKSKTDVHLRQQKKTYAKRLARTMRKHYKVRKLTE